VVYNEVKLTTKWLVDLW